MDCIKFYSDMLFYKDFPVICVEYSGCFTNIRIFDYKFLFSHYWCCRE